MASKEARGLAFVLCSRAYYQATFKALRLSQADYDVYKRRIETALYIQRNNEPAKARLLIESIPPVTQAKQEPQVGRSDIDL